MKYIVIVPDGAADYPHDALGGKTALEAADTPNFDKLASAGIVGRCKTVPKGFIPASDVANLSLLGYDPFKYYAGRAPFEAANMGIELNQNDVAFRCNLITAGEGNLLDSNAGHITTDEAKKLIAEIDKALGDDVIRFYPGISYRHLMVFRGGADVQAQRLRTTAPHDIVNMSIEKHLPKGKGAERLIDLMRKSTEVLERCDVNKVRVDLGQNPANMIWLWGQGQRANLPSFKDRFGLTGAVISAVDLINGIGKAAGLDSIKVPGATGYFDTNYKGKADAAVAALEKHDFVFVHVEAPDEAGHSGDLREKMISLERIDKTILGTLLKKYPLDTAKYLVAPDHFTPVAVGTHTAEPVPFVIAGHGVPKSVAEHFTEEEAQRSSLYFEEGSLLMDYFIKER